MERDLERSSIEHVRDSILELGKGFAFVGSQHSLAVGGQEFFLDLLFYHLRLRCYVVIDLKIEEFKPEFAGKMNVYLSAEMAKAHDRKWERESIGMLIMDLHLHELVSTELLHAVMVLSDVLNRVVRGQRISFEESQRTLEAGKALLAELNVQQVVAGPS